MNDNNILAVVLAGGLSKRFGKDKNQAKLGNLTLLEHVLAKVSKKFEKILIISNQKLNIENKDSITVIPDCIKGNLGPLIGILSAMKWIREKKLHYEWIASFPSDTPFFNISIVEKYMSIMKSNKSLLYFVKSNGKRHNIFGLWSLKLINELEKDLVQNHYRKVEDWSNKIGVETIDVKIEKFDPFFNINKKEDLEQAEKILKENKND
tara:strand:+ start:1061 stop:1684 length:624 start_codon:yes stop_codon:yes gene_type:complete